MTEHPHRSLPQFYLTAPSPCPYLEGREEKKVFTHLLGETGKAVHDSLAIAGFRRSQHIAYRPACDGCNACISVRVVVNEFKPSRSQRRVCNANTDLIRDPCPASATKEQFGLMRDYLDTRHSGGGMSMMTSLEFAAMVEETPIDTAVIEYRNQADKRLIAAALTDRLQDGLSMVYSFFDPSAAARSLGSYMILDHIAFARELGLPYVYLGYWVAGSRKMDYKTRFQPLQSLYQDGWHRLEDVPRQTDGA